MNLIRLRCLAIPSRSYSKDPSCRYRFLPEKIDPFISKEIQSEPKAKPIPKVFKLCPDFTIPLTKSDQVIHDLYFNDFNRQSLTQLDDFYQNENCQKSLLESVFRLDHHLRESFFLKLLNQLQNLENPNIINLEILGSSIANSLLSKIFKSEHALSAKTKKKIYIDYKRLLSEESTALIIHELKKSNREYKGKAKNKRVETLIRTMKKHQFFSASEHRKKRVRFLMQILEEYPMYRNLFFKNLQVSTAVEVMDYNFDMLKFLEVITDLQQQHQYYKADFKSLLLKLQGLKKRIENVEQSLKNLNSKRQPVHKLSQNQEVEIVRNEDPQISNRQIELNDFDENNLEKAFKEIESKETIEKCSDSQFLDELWEETTSFEIKNEKIIKDDTQNEVKPDEIWQEKPRIVDRINDTIKKIETINWTEVQTENSPIFSEATPVEKTRKDRSLKPSDIKAQKDEQLSQFQEISPEEFQNLCQLLIANSNPDLTKHQNHPELTSYSEPNWVPGNDDLVDRADYRSKLVFTIDPETAKDLDDAIHVETHDDYIELGVQDVHSKTLLKFFSLSKDF